MDWYRHLPMQAASVGMMTIALSLVASKMFACGCVATLFVWEPQSDTVLKWCFLLCTDLALTSRKCHLHFWQRGLLQVVCKGQCCFFHFFGCLEIFCFFLSLSLSLSLSILLTSQERFQFRKETPPCPSPHPTLTPESWVLCWQSNNQNKILSHWPMSAMSGRMKFDTVMTVH